MSTQETPIVLFLKKVMRRRQRLPSQLAADLGLATPPLAAGFLVMIFPAQGLARGWQNISN